MNRAAQPVLASLQREKVQQIQRLLPHQEAGSQACCAQAARRMAQTRRACMKLQSHMTVNPVCNIGAGGCCLH